MGGKLLEARTLLPILPLAIGVLTGLSCTAVQEPASQERYAPERVTRTAYDQAASLLSQNVQGTVKNAEVAPRWIGERDEFWYERDTLVDALIEADRDFDLLLLPNRDHFFTHEPYFIRRRWDYFVRHLLGAEPPAGYSLP